MILATLMCLVIASSVAAQVEFSRPNWSERDALAAAARSNTNARLQPLLEQARQAGDSSNEQALLHAIGELAHGDDLTDPARERILFDFAQGLAELPPGAAGPAVIDYLLAYAPRTLVPHPDNPRVGTPLFNIRGATAGTLNAWQRQLGYDTATSLFQAGASSAAQSYVEAFRRAPPARRRGLLEALSEASTEQLFGIADRVAATGQEAKTGSVQDADINVLAAHAALMLGDTASLRRALAHGQGPEQASLLVQAARELDAPSRIDLLFSLLDSGTPGNAALAVGALAPGLLLHPEVPDRLFALLADADRGAACALVLSAAAQPEIRERLERVASGEDLAARRAAIALQMRPPSRTGGAP